jgi:hypothetical protein
MGRGEVTFFFTNILIRKHIQKLFGHPKVLKILYFFDHGMISIMSWNSNYVTFIEISFKGICVIFAMSYFSPVYFEKED